jgi:hypothetical protein
VTGNDWAFKPLEELTINNIIHIDFKKKYLFTIGSGGYFQSYL